MGKLLIEVEFPFLLLIPIDAGVAKTGWLEGIGNGIGLMTKRSIEQKRDGSLFVVRVLTCDYRCVCSLLLVSATPLGLHFPLLRSMVAIM